MSSSTGVRLFRGIFSFAKVSSRIPRCRSLHVHRCCMATFAGAGPGGLAMSLWNRHRSQAMEALYHPFVVNIAAGVLNTESFRNYIAQDTFFLQAFSTAYTQVQENIDDYASKLVVDHLLQAVMDELKVHNSYAKAWEGDLSSTIEPNKSTSKYIEFLLAAARGKESTMGDATLDRQSIAALTVGAMTPCMRLYAFLGEEIVKHLDEDYTKSTYHEWIKKYSSKDFQSATLQVEHLLDTLAENLAEDDVSKLGRLYSQAMTLELEFFSAQPKCQCALLPFVRRQVDGIDASYLLIMDFDFTCSVMDSCSPLANASIQAAMQRVESDSARCHQISGLELRKRWESLEKSYGENYSKLIDVIEHQEHNVTHFDADGLHSFLERLSEFEVQANSAVIEQEVFDGLKLEDAQEEGHNVVFQEGCPNFLRQISLHNNVTAHVISVCWSKSYIEGALSEEGLDFIEVHSNEFITNGSSTLGGIKRLVETPFDKERVMKELIRNADGLLGPIRSIFIGDSVSDILCLLEADLGIVIGSNPRLQRVTEAFGVTLLPLYKGVVSQVQLGNLEFTKNAGILYTVRDWHEIQAFMISNLGYSAKTPP